MFCAFKSRGSIVSTFYTQAAQQFPCLLQTFYGQRGPFPRKGMVYSVGYKRVNKRPIREGEIKKPNPNQTNNHFVVTLPCSDSCVVVLIKVGLPVSWNDTWSPRPVLPDTQCNFLSWCSMPFRPEACRVEWHCWGRAQPWCIRVTCAVPPAAGDWSLLHVAAGSDVHGFLRCLIACTTGYVGEESPLSNLNMRVTPFMPTSCAQDLPLSLQDYPGSLCISCAGWGVCCCRVCLKWEVSLVKGPLVGIWC